MKITSTVNAYKYIRELREMSGDCSSTSSPVHTSINDNIKDQFNLAEPGIKKLNNPLATSSRLRVVTENGVEVLSTTAMKDFDQFKAYFYQESLFDRILKLIDRLFSSHLAPTCPETSPLQKQLLIEHPQNQLYVLLEFREVKINWNTIQTPPLKESRSLQMIYLLNPSNDTTKIRDYWKCRSVETFFMDELEKTQAFKASKNF